MSRLRAIVILVAVLLVVAPGPARSGTEWTLKVITDRDHLNVGESVGIEVRLWSVMEGRILPALGGVLTVRVVDAARGVAVRTFRAEPDGRAQSFRVSWSPGLTGGYRISAGYENVFSGERIESEALVTVGLGPGPGGSPSPAATLPASTATASPPPATAPPTATTLPAPAATAPPESSGLATRVELRLEPNPRRGGLIIRIRILTGSGKPLSRGEVLVAVDRGSLSRGGGREVLVGLDSRGRASLGWNPGSDGQGRVTVDYLGGWVRGREYAASSAEQTAGPAETYTAASTTSLPPTTTTAPPTTTTRPAPTTTALPTTSTAPPTTTTLPAAPATRPAPPATTSPPALERPVRVVQGQTTTNTLGMVFRLIPAGEFTMGSAGGRNAPRYASPAHRVRLTRDFWLGVHEVTQGQWQKVMGGRPSKFRGDPNRPVERVSPLQVREFIKRLNAREGTTAYRLPTEAEWEYACRAGTTDPWFFGGEPRLLGRFAWWISNSGLQTRPVGQLEPNPWGLFDILGNVAELCGDWYDRNYYQESPAQDPRGPEQGTHRVARGGSWQSGPTRLRSAARVMAEAGPGLGFRLVREP